MSSLGEVGGNVMKTLYLVLVLVLLASTAWAEGYDNGIACFDKLGNQISCLADIDILGANATILDQKPAGEDCGIEGEMSICSGGKFVPIIAIPVDCEKACAPNDMGRNDVTDICRQICRVANILEEMKK